METTLTGFQGIKRCIKYLDSNPCKPIFYPFHSYDGSNYIGLTCSWNQVEKYTTHNFLECHHDADHAIIIKRRRSVSGIIHTLLGTCSAKLCDKNGQFLGFIPHTSFSIFDLFMNICTLLRNTLIYLLLFSSIFI